MEEANAKGLVVALLERELGKLEEGNARPDPATAAHLMRACELLNLGQYNQALLHVNLVLQPSAGQGSLSTSATASTPAVEDIRALFKKAFGGHDSNN